MTDPLFYDSSKRAKNLTAKIRSLNPKVIGFLSFGMILAITFSIWFFYPDNKMEPENLPIIKANMEPIRIKPERSEVVENIDYNSRIYETFGQSNQPRRIENLLKPEDKQELPMEREELFAGINTQPQQQSQVISITESPFGTSTSSETKNTNPSNDIIEAPSSEVLQEDKITVSAPPKIKKDADVKEIKLPPPGVFSSASQKIDKSEEIAAVKTEPAAGASLPPKAPPAPKKETALETGNYYVQLASIQDKAKTNSAWSKLTSKHSLLKSTSYRTQTADIEGKGTFYRIQAGPLSKSSATTLCDRIKAQSGSCFITSK